VKWIGRKREACGPSEVARTLLEKCRVEAVSGTENVAAWQAFVRLNDGIRPGADDPACGAREAAFARKSREARRIAANEVDVASCRPPSRQQGDSYTARNHCRDDAIEHEFAATELREPLADENDALRQCARLDAIRLVRHVRGVHQGQFSGAVVPLLSLIVITRNEEASIERCLRSAAFADEIVVVDNHSADKTVEIARRLGAKVISAPDWPGFGPQKNRALEAATGEWVLSLDADEWIEQPLADEIKAAMRDPAAADGYEMPRRSRFCGKVVGHCGWWPDYVLRLWRRGRGRFVDAPVHERVEVEGKVSRFTSPIEHEAIIDLADARDKSKRYAAAAAAELVSQGKRSSRTKARIRAGAAFVRTYVWRAGFLDGATGFHVARYNSDYTYQKWARVADATTRNS
jgi:hypothetical protein